MDALHTSVETVKGEIDRLVAERQELRATGAAPGTLEENRRRICDAQARLSRLLIRSHLAPRAA